MMASVRERAEKAFSKADNARTSTDKRDQAFFAERKAREAANLEKTKKLKALRLAHEATLPKVEKKVRGKKAVAKAPAKAEVEAEG